MKAQKSTKRKSSNRIKFVVKTDKITENYGTLLTVKGWEQFKKKFMKDFNYGGMSIHRHYVLKYIYEELLIKTM